MTLAAIGTAIGTMVKAAATAVGTLSLGQVIALGTVIGVAGYTTYVLVKHAKSRINHATNKKAKERTVTEQILDQDVEEVNVDSMSDEELLNSDPVDSIGLGNFLRRECKKKMTKKNTRKSSSLFDRVRDFAEEKIDPKKYNERKKKEERKRWSNAQWAEYYCEQMHRMNDTPEEFAKWKKNHDPITEDRTRRGKNAKNKKKQPIRVKEGEPYPFDTMKNPFDLDSFEKRVIRNDKWEEERYRRHRNKPLSEIPFNMLDYQ